MFSSMRLLALTTMLLLSMSFSSGFHMPSSASTTKTLSTRSHLQQHQQKNFVVSSPGHQSSSTSLNDRQWNFNEGDAPWGMKGNAEIWNGRVAQMAFVFIFLQELIQGKGVVQGLQEGVFVNLICAGLFVVSVVSLTVWLAIQGDDDYVSRDLGMKK